MPAVEMKHFCALLSKEGEEPTHSHSRALSEVKFNNMEIKSAIASAGA
jgi:hypothetical protein